MGKARRKMRNMARKARRVAGKVKAKTIVWEGKAKKELVVAKKKFVAAERKAKGYIRSHPEKAALIAAGIGAAIGAAVTAAMRKKRR